MFAGKLAGLMNPLSTMDCENECDSLFLKHGFPLQSGCAKIEPLLFYTSIYRFTERFIYIYIFFYIYIIYRFTAEIYRPTRGGFPLHSFFPVDLTLEAPWVMAEALRIRGACGHRSIAAASRWSCPE